MFAIAVNIFCGIGAIAGGFIEDRIGAFKTVRLSLFCLLVLGTGILLAPTEIWFWVFALLVGIFIGPVQSSSRSLVAKYAPTEHRAQIFWLLYVCWKIYIIYWPRHIWMASNVYWS